MGLKSRAQNVDEHDMHQEGRQVIICQAWVARFALTFFVITNESLHRQAIGRRPRCIHYRAR